MDNQPVQENRLKNLLNRKVILTILAAIVLIEVIWAVAMLQSTKQTPPVTTVTTPSPISISLTADKRDIKVGERVTVNINLSSQVNSDGTDLLINFDPALLSVEDTTPVKPGTIYSSYPQNRLEGGKITVSGITDKDEGVLASGLFGAVVFQAKAAGLAKLSFEFSLSSTTDSNIIESGTGKDVLEKVEDLEVNIRP